ncbi:MAG: hypothetical protein U0841_22440 [Chloroflexia bacterium]
MVVVADVVDRQVREAVVVDEFREVGHALVDPGFFVAVVVEVDQVLVLVGEGAFVEERDRPAVPAGACRIGLVRRGGTGAMLPIERVDRDHVAVERAGVGGAEEPADIGGYGWEVVEIIVADVVDQDDIARRSGVVVGGDAELLRQGRFAAIARLGLPEVIGVRSLAYLRVARADSRSAAG